jgi:hypothetical protein
MLFIPIIKLPFMPNRPHPIYHPPTTKTSSTMDFLKLSKRTITPEEVGMSSSVKNLWQKKPRNNYDMIPVWVEKKPYNVKLSPEESPENKQHALVLRHMISRGIKGGYALHSIIVQSPHLKSALKEILRDYPGVSPGLDELTFEAPFEPFVHRWDKLCNAIDDKKGKKRDHLKLLQGALAGSMKEVLQRKNDLIKNGLMTYNYLWTIFEPGQLLYAYIDGHERVFKLVKTDYNITKGFILELAYVDWDGTIFGFTRSMLAIGRFDGTRPIDSLLIYPLQFNTDVGLQERLLKRAKIFEGLKGSHYKAYEGVSVQLGLLGEFKQQATGRIIVDAESYYLFNPHKQSHLEAFNEAKTGALRTRTTVVYDSESSDDEAENPALRQWKYQAQIDEQNRIMNMHNGNDVNQHRIQNSVLNNELNLLGEKTSKNLDMIPALTDEQLLLCTPLIKGYSLKTKKWGSFYVDHITDIKWDDRAFESLVLPRDHKELILTFVESQVLYKEAFDDVIQGKGKGIIMLLSGPPGVGKTLTAESGKTTLEYPMTISNFEFSCRTYARTVVLDRSWRAGTRFFLC